MPRAGTRTGSLPFASTCRASSPLCPGSRRSRAAYLQRRWRWCVLHKSRWHPHGASARMTHVPPRAGRAHTLATAAARPPPAARAQDGRGAAHAAWARVGGRQLLCGPSHCGRGCRVGNGLSHMAVGARARELRARRAGVGGAAPHQACGGAGRGARGPVRGGQKQAAASRGVGHGSHGARARGAAA